MMLVGNLRFTGVIAMMAFFACKILRNMLDGMHRMEQY